MGMKDPRWFRKKYKKFKKLVKKRGTTFVGLGCIPISKNSSWDLEVHKLLSELMEYEPFAEYVRTEVFGLNEAD